MTSPIATRPARAAAPHRQISPPVQRTSPPLTAALIAIGAAAIAGPLALIAFGPQATVPDELAKIKRPKRVLTQAELPQVEPLRLAALSNQDAQSFNATVPFSTAPNPAARPFIMTGGIEDYARAVDCLAAATWYEAGDDPVGQRSLAQVVINRMRHPAFPKTICGVVFQGQERRTGCQFTFTCDGAMRRTPSPAAWTRAQILARQALSGTVFAQVGHATHYHTDWVVPYWSSSLDKVTKVKTHLFFRWTGWWGTPGAFRGRHADSEPVIAKLAGLSSFHNGGLPPAIGVDGMMIGGVGLTPETIPDAAIPKPLAASGDSFHVALDKSMGADGFAALAIRTCGERSYCKFLGWTDTGKLPPAGATPTASQLEAMSFSYLRDKEQGFGKALWNCTEFKRPSPIQCMRRTPTAPHVAPHAAPHPGAAPNAPGDSPTREGLFGVRRKGDAPAPNTPSGAGETLGPSANPTPAPAAPTRSPAADSTPN